MYKIIKSLLLITLLTLSISNYLSAQGEFKKMEFSETQKTEIKALKDSMHEEALKIKNDESLSVSERHSLLKELREEYHEKFQALLTDEQLKIIENNKTEKGAHFEKNKDKFEGFREAMKAYHEENVKPFMQRQRMELDKLMVADDVTTINEMREKALALRQELMAERKNEKEIPHTRIPPLFDGKKQMHFLGAYKEKYPNDMETLVQYTNTYESELADLQKKIQVQEKTWRSEIEAIRLEYFGEDKRTHKDNKHPHIPKDKEEMIKQIKHVGFLLMLSEDIDKTKPSSTINRKMLAFPNPSISPQNSLEFEVLKDGKVLIELVDERGNLIRQLLEEELPTGVYQRTFDFGNTDSRVLYYRVTDGAGVSTQKIILAE